MADADRKMVEAESCSSSGEEVDVESLLDDIMQTKMKDIVKDEINERFSEISIELNKIDKGFNYLADFNSKVDSCVDKMKETLGKWVFPRISADNANKMDVSVLDLPSGVIPSPKTYSTVATKKVTNRFLHGKPTHPSKFPHSQAPFDQTSEVIPVKKVMPTAPKLPPIGARVIKPPLHVGMKVYCMASTFKGMWYSGSIIEIIENKSNNAEKYRVKFDRKKPNIRTMSGKTMAYMLRPNVILPVGTRVIAEYKDEPVNPEQSSQSPKKGYANALYVGIIAEPPKSMNFFRYLIFFDDGYAQYSPVEEVYLVCESSKNVWEDIHPDTRLFVKEYLTQYPERPMVKLQRGQSIRTEWNGSWWNAKVVAVNGSLVKMFFEADKRTEWIYRGSTRLGPLFDKLIKKEENTFSRRVKRQGLTSAFNSQKLLPYIEYTYSTDDRVVEEEVEKKVDQPATTSRNVAKKSSSKPAARSDPPAEIQKEVSTDGTVEKIYVNISMLPTYKFHRKCSPACLHGSPDSFEAFKGTNPLEVPTYCNWRREIVKDRPGRKKLVFYVAPCGRRLRNIEETNSYLLLTMSKLTIDLFCFDSFVQTFQNFNPGNILMQIKDIAYGKENIPISSVNTIDNKKPDYVEYSTKRIPGKEVPLNLDHNFLLCCNCTDNCQDSSKCSCQQLTIEATKLASGDFDLKAGYVNRRLEEQVFTGLYECNQKCKCDKRCMNRVVQNGLRNRLQLFKTVHKGWGLRTLDDIPKGSFLCIYAGQLLTEHEANKDGTKYGDEYMAELDYIEVVENQNKEGYESDVPESEDEGHGGDISDSSMSSAGSGDYASSDYENQWQPQSDGSVRKSTRTAQQGKQDVRDKQVENTESEEDESKASKEEELPDLKNVDRYVISQPQILVRPLSPETEEKLKSLKTARRIRLNVNNERIDTDTEEEKKSAKSASHHSDSETRESSDKEEMDSNDDIVPSRIMSPTIKHSHSLGYSKNSIISTNQSNKEIDNRNRASVRSYFGEQYCYVMDAKSSGNIGRYLNHSCSPNVFVQNVFVDTHDLRFPWVAFFAGQMIKAGDELTWDYNYEVGTVKGREIYCHCGSTNCRGRLL